VTVVGVQFKRDGAKLGAEGTSALYAITWDSTMISNENHTFAAIGSDAAGNTATSAAVAGTVSKTFPGVLRAYFERDLVSDTSVAGLLLGLLWMAVQTVRRIARGFARPWRSYV